MFSAGDTVGGVYSAPDHLAVFKGPTSKGSEGKGKRGEGEGKVRGKKEEVEGGI